MLQAIDEALAVAVDAVADDIEEGVRRIKAKGVVAALGDEMTTVVEELQAAAGGLLGDSGGVLQVLGEEMRGFFGAPEAPQQRPPAAAAYPRLRQRSWEEERVREPAEVEPMARGGGAGQAQDRSPATPAEPPLPAAEVAERFKALWAREPENGSCFDCSGRRAADWASVSFGVFICADCCAHHRQLGTHISVVRSCNKDSWTEAQLQCFAHGGNRRLKAFFKANQVCGDSFRSYQTGCATWYRDRWMKNRLLNCAVPRPPTGIEAGPCDLSAPDGREGSAHEAAPRRAEAPASGVNLMDWSAPVPSAATSAHVADRLQQRLVGLEGTPRASAAPAAHPVGLAPVGRCGVLASGDAQDFDPNRSAPALVAQPAMQPVLQSHGSWAASALPSAHPAPVPPAAPWPDLAWANEQVTSSSVPSMAATYGGKLTQSAAMTSQGTNMFGLIQGSSQPDAKHGGNKSSLPDFIKKTPTPMSMKNAAHGDPFSECTWGK